MNNLNEQLRQLGIQCNDTVMVHASFKSLGINDPEVFILDLLEVLGEDGTLLMPALSDEQDPPHVHNNLTTPSNVGYLAEFFRNRPGTLRSLHPTHSVCGVGGQALDILERHAQDTTPCGPNSPFNQLFNRRGKILMVGCGLEPNTSIHAIEEYVKPPYLFGPPVVYTLTDAKGNTFDKTYTPHDFEGYTQRYDRVETLLGTEGLITGKVGQAKSYLMRSEILFDRVLEMLKKDPFYFVELDVDDD
ncbi:MAG: AAC(3) family N-acetyltransferase [Chloroflexi bacterium HGW-Chloroflexi-4]|jgi:aminoglycoside 3-N-acetyltransferase|nr:MAG: AAC(3) family N-acetyltransferase [Chloroflexi bacterium HGW-Chloroflexi-4]